MIRTTTALFMLALAAQAAGPAAQVESPDGRTAIEALAAGPEQRARRCDILRRDYEKDPAPEGIDALFFCLGHADGHTRSSTLSAFVQWKTIKRPDFGTAFYPRLKKAVELYSWDPDFDVRYAAGDLSRMLEYWYNFESPAAAERRMRFYHGHPPREAPEWSLHLAAFAVALVTLIVVLQAGKRRSR